MAPPPSRRASARRVARLATLFATLLAGVAAFANIHLQVASVAYAVEHRRVDPRTGLLEIPVDELVAAVRRKDRAEIGRVAERLGAARLAETLRQPDGPTVTAGLAGILALSGRERLIGPVAELVGGSDPALALAGLRTLGEILATVTAADLDDWEIPPDVIKTACAALRVTAVLAQNPTVNRLAALDALADATLTCPPALTPDFMALSRDPTPSIRRGAALVLRPQQRLATGGVSSSGIRDVDRSVASASVAALCASMASPALLVTRRNGREPLLEQTRQVARRMVGAPDTAPEDAVEMLDCLDPSLATDRQMLERFRGRRRTPVGDRANEIMAAFANRQRP